MFFSETPVVPPIFDLLSRAGWDYRFFSLSTSDNLGVDHSRERLFAGARAGDFDSILIEPPRGSFRGPGAAARAKHGSFGLGPRSGQDDDCEIISFGNYLHLKAIELFRLAYVLRVTVLLAVPASAVDGGAPASEPVFDL